MIRPIRGLIERFELVSCLWNGGPFFTSLLCSAIIYTSAGCRPPHQENLPTVLQQDEPSETKAIVARSKLLKDVSGTGTLELTRPNGESVVFDLAVAMKEPDYARFRAWKFGQAVLDLTILPTGVWLETSQQGDRKDQITSVGDTASRITHALAMLNGGFFDDPSIIGQDTGDQLIITRHKEGEPAVMCWVDRKTLSPRRFRMIDNDGVVRFTLDLADYFDVGGAIWPRRVTAVSAAGTVVVALDDVTLNGGSPDGAFVPPSHAEKLR